MSAANSNGNGSGNGSGSNNRPRLRQPFIMNENDSLDVRGICRFGVKMTKLKSLKGHKTTY